MQEIKAKLKCNYTKNAIWSYANMMEWENETTNEKFSTKLQRNLLENLQHDNIQKMDSSFEGESSLPFKDIWMVEIKMKMVDDQWWNLKIDVIHVNTQVNQ